MTVWATSDLHLQHVNILRYSRRSFITGKDPKTGLPTPTPDDVERMTREVITRYNARVQPGDLVYILGDLAMGQKDKHPELLRQLNGTKILVYGNHDERFIKDPTTKKSRPETLDEIRARYLGMGFSEVYDHLMVTHPDYGLIYMRHIPDPNFTGNLHFCGHVHEDFDRIGNIINVGVDVRDLEPKTFKELVEAPFKGYLTDKPHRPMEDYAKDKN